MICLRLIFQLFEMHTIPHQLITGAYGNIAEETVQTLPSISNTDIKIKRMLDGNTFIGYDGMDQNHWVGIIEIVFLYIAWLWN